MELETKTPLIEIEGLTFSFGANKVLDDVTFCVYEKERLSIIGPNGAGKSTLVKLINRILTNAKGSIAIKGRPLMEYGQKELARLIGYVPQTSELFFPYTVHEFILMGRYPHVSPFTSITDEDEQAVGDAMAMTGTTAYADRALDSLSGGERQKVYIAAALAQGATTLLLDEPTTFLDPKAQDDILATLERVNEEMGVTVISVTHDINSAAMWSGKIIALKEGRVKFIGTPEGVMKGEVLKEIYNKDFLFATHPETGAPMIVPGVAR